MRQPYLLIIEATAVNALATGSISSCDITTLHHEASNVTMEKVALVVELRSPLASAEHAEVLCRLGHHIVEDLENYFAIMVSWLSLFANRDIHEDLDVLRVEVGQARFLSYLSLLSGRLFCVDSFFEESFEAFLRFYVLLFPHLLNCLVLSAKVGILWR